MFDPMITMWVGSYPPAGLGSPSGRGEGIFRVDGVAGTSTASGDGRGSTAGGMPVRMTARLATPSPAASFLARTGDGRMLYAVGEEKQGTVSAFTMDGDGTPRLSRTVPSGGALPCHLWLDEDAGWLWVSNYGDGVFAALRVRGDGDLTGEIVRFPPADVSPSHAHSLTPVPDEPWLLGADLGTDTLRRLRRDGEVPAEDGVAARLPAASGPRHVVARADLLYVTCELAATVAVLRWDSRNARAHLLGVVPAGIGDARGSQAPGAPSHLVLSGNRLYVAVRGSDTITTFAVEDPAERAGATGLQMLAQTPTATWPRHMDLVGGSLVVAGEHAHVLAVHPLDGDGVVLPVSQEVPVAASPSFVLPG